MNEVTSAGLRSYFGGESEAIARKTVVLDAPNLFAIRVFGTPSAANLRINAQSSVVITPQSLMSVHCSSAETVYFPSAVDTVRS
ncbi:hypothetical protein [Tessaracoccus sp. OS52]|uniref:hypothetical protein n=1 Tax=Tessaracoccus sp. OS52 TaxID=2886691 RepID=UPI00351D16B5